MNFKLNTGEGVELLESLGDDVFKVQVRSTKQILLVLLTDLEEGCRERAAALPRGDGLMWASDGAAVRDVGGEA